MQEASAVVALKQYRECFLEATARGDKTLAKIAVYGLLERCREGQCSAFELDASLVFHHVAWVGDELIGSAKYLVSFGCDPFFRDSLGNTVAHYAARGCNVTLLKYLFGLHKYRVLNETNRQQFTIFLTVAAEAPDDRIHNLLYTLEWLYLHGCSLETPDINGVTGLMWGCRRGSLPLVQWFLSHGANLGHRDYYGRTVLHMAVASGEQEALRLVVRHTFAQQTSHKVLVAILVIFDLIFCNAGALHLLDCISHENNTQPSTPLKLCWMQRKYSLALCLLRWPFCKRFFGRLSLFQNVFAKYYWMVMGWTFLVFLVFTMHLEKTYRSQYPCAVFVLLFGLAQVFWIIAFITDPGYLKRCFIPDQGYRCSSNLDHDIQQLPVFGYRPTSACHRLQQLERECETVGAVCADVNRAASLVARQAPWKLPLHLEELDKRCKGEMQRIRDQMYQLIDRVAQERRLSCSKGYASRVLQGDGRQLCFTCRLVRPIQTHHCGECAHCIQRFDHHCVWIDNCVGKRNQPSFQLFLFCLLLAIMDLWYIFWLYYQQRIDEKPEDISNLDVLTEPLFYIALSNACVNVFWAAFIGHLFIRTIRSMLTNVTFYEYLTRPEHTQKRFNGKTQGWFWDFRGLTLEAMLQNIWAYWGHSDMWKQEETSKPSLLQHPLMEIT